MFENTLPQTDDFISIQSTQQPRWIKYRQSIINLISIFMLCIFGLIIYGAYSIYDEYMNKVSDIILFLYILLIVYIDFSIITCGFVLIAYVEYSH